MNKLLTIYSRPENQLPCFIMMQFSHRLVIIVTFTPRAAQYTSFTPYIVLNPAFYRTYLTALGMFSEIHLS